ncbi:MAG TPA: MBL fold metallo-hydrolase [Armatimonadota bacterium]|nr:MBL fold metallo-hydrolase [Armatimonadota bacterium]
MLVPENGLLIQYLGHASFLITTGGGTRVLFDPYDTSHYGDTLRYAPITEAADLAVITHHHADHARTADLPGAPTLIDGLELAQSGPRTFADLTLRAVHAYHDTHKGQDRGEDAMVLLETAGLRLCHAGDLGHLLDAEQIRALSPLDVLLLPVGGHYTVDAAAATQVMESLAPRLTIPMHYLTPRTSFPIAPVDDFLRGKANVIRPGGSDLAVTRESLPTQPQIVVLVPLH